MGSGREGVKKGLFLVQIVHNDPITSQDKESPYRKLPHVHISGKEQMRVCFSYS